MKIYIKRLGCPKNDVDADYIAGRIESEGHSIVANESDADAVVVNTCGFILPAKEESINEILRYEKLKTDGAINKLYVTGCLSQRYGDELADEIKGIDGIFGLGRHDSLLNKMNDSKNSLPMLNKESSNSLQYLSENVRYVDQSYPYEYVKIADGCDRYCSYCSIPHIRGRFRSRPIDEIVREVEFLASKDKREIILVSQEGTGYGKDLQNDISPVELLKELEKIVGVEWIRLLYLHPESLTNELIDYMTISEKTLGYFDMPLQHISDNMLKIMNRKIDRKEIEARLENIRNASPDNIIRTTFIAGHPGETDDDYKQLHDFINDFGFDRLGVFGYSSEEGTGAYKMAEKIDDELIGSRVDELMLLQQEIAFEKNITLIDKRVKVIIDEKIDAGAGIGRTIGDCPEIDQSVKLSGEGLNVGDIVSAVVVETDGYDLVAETDK